MWDLKQKTTRKLFYYSLCYNTAQKVWTFFELPRRQLEKNIKLAIICSLFSPISNIPKQSKYQEVSLRMQILFVISCYKV